MKRTSCGVLLLALTIATAAVAQGTPAPQPTGNKTPQAPPTSRPRVEPTSNIKIDLTVTDMVAGAAPQKKSVSLLVADGQMGRIRAQSGLGVERPGPVEPILNVDATPHLASGRVRLQVSLDYAAPPTGSDAVRLARVTEFGTVLLESGKSVVISESADPAVDRKVIVEVTATILK